jgi:hypothetical protein
MMAGAMGRLTKWIVGLTLTGVSVPDVCGMGMNEPIAIFGIHRISEINSGKFDRLECAFLGSFGCGLKRHWISFHVLLR